MYTIYINEISYSVRQYLLYCEFIFYLHVPSICLYIYIYISFKGISCSQKILSLANEILPNLRPKY